MYDARLGRWLRTDPYYQHHSPYLAMSNNPVSFVDPTGGADYSWIWEGDWDFDYGELGYYDGTSWMTSFMDWYSGLDASSQNNNEYYKYLSELSRFGEAEMMRSVLKETKEVWITTASRFDGPITFSKMQTSYTTNYAFKTYKPTFGSGGIDWNERAINDYEKLSKDNNGFLDSPYLLPEGTLRINSKENIFKIVGKNSSNGFWLPYYKNPSDKIKKLIYVKSDLSNVKLIYEPTLATEQILDMFGDGTNYGFYVNGIKLTTLVVRGKGIRNSHLRWWQQYAVSLDEQGKPVRNRYVFEFLNKFTDYRWKGGISIEMKNFLMEIFNASPNDEGDGVTN